MFASDNSKKIVLFSRLPLKIQSTESEFFSFRVLRVFECFQKEIDDASSSVGSRAGKFQAMKEFHEAKNSIKLRRFSIESEY